MTNLTTVNEDARSVGDTARAERPTVHKSHIDKSIWGLYIALVVVSLIELFSASSREVTEGHIMSPLFRHAMLLGGGTLIMLLLQRVHYRVFYKYAWWIVVLSVVATIYTMFFGQVINGARRSFSLGICSVQPSELLKFSAALIIAKVLGDGQIKVDGRPQVSDKAIITVAIVVLIFSLMIVNQGLTNTILLMAISLSMMLIGGVSWRKWMMVVAVYGALGLVYMGYSHIKASSRENTEDAIESVEAGRETDRSQVRASRMDYYLTPNKYDLAINSENQQSQYAFIAQANGGVFGVGPGNSRETARLPLAFSDYIYAIVIEDTGLVGGLAVMAIYLLLLARAGYVANKLRKAFPALLIIGMAVFIVYQALFHMAIVSGLFPVSGQPLPFISKGGSSVIVSSIALGIMLSVSRYAPRKDEKPGTGRYLDADTTDRAMADNPS